LDNTKLKTALLCAHEYLNTALELMDSGDLKNTDVHLETLRAYNRTVEALRLLLVQEQRDEGGNVLQFPIVNSRGI
jgi:hypothetical protein